MFFFSKRIAVSLKIAHPSIWPPINSRDERLLLSSLATYQRYDIRFDSTNYQIATHHRRRRVDMIFLQSRYTSSHISSDVLGMIGVTRIRYICVITCTHATEIRAARLSSCDAPLRTT